MSSCTRYTCGRSQPLRPVRFLQRLRPPCAHDSIAARYENSDDSEVSSEEEVANLLTNSSGSSSKKPVPKESSGPSMALDEGRKKNRTSRSASPGRRSPSMGRSTSATLNSANRTLRQSGKPARANEPFLAQAKNKDGPVEPAILSHPSGSTESFLPLFRPSGIPTSPAKRHRGAYSPSDRNVVNDSEEDEGPYVRAVAPSDGPNGSSRGSVISGEKEQTASLSSGLERGVSYLTDPPRVNIAKDSTGESLPAPQQSRLLSTEKSLSQDLLVNQAGSAKVARSDDWQRRTMDAATELNTKYAKGDLSGVTAIKGKMDGQTSIPPTPTVVSHASLGAHVTGSAREHTLGELGVSPKAVPAGAVPPARVIIDISDSEDEKDELDSNEILDPVHQQDLAEARAGKCRADPDEVPQEVRHQLKLVAPFQNSQTSPSLHQDVAASGFLQQRALPPPSAVQSHPFLRPPDLITVAPTDQPHLSESMTVRSPAALRPPLRPPTHEHLSKSSTPAISAVSGPAGRLCFLDVCQR